MDGNGIGDDKGDQADHMTDAKLLGGMPYFSFGLGNKTYQHFNAIGKRLHKRIEMLGGIPITPLGAGDDDKSMEEDFLEWKETFMVDIAKFYDIEAKSKPLKTDVHIPLFIRQDVPPNTQMYIGELTSANTRKWTDVKNLDSSFSPKDHIYIKEKGEGHIYREQAAASSYDAKHPFYGRFQTSREMFRCAMDSQTFDQTIKTDSLPLSKATVNGKQVNIERHCYHIELDLTASGMTYQTGDHLGIWGNNDAADVERLGALLHIKDLDEVLLLAPNPQNVISDTAKVPFPTPCTIRTAMTNYVDINSFLKQYQFEILAKYASDPRERDLLWNYAQDRVLFIKNVESQQSTVSDILSEFPSLKLPIEVVLAGILPRIAVRYYSISSSAKEDPSLVSITAVVVRYALAQTQASDKRAIIKEGLATSWLQRLHEKQKSNNSNNSNSRLMGNNELPPHYVPMYIRSSNFRLPADSTKPIVMVGPGTGVAPFRAFLRERMLMAMSGKSVGPAWLFYGCRNEQSDYLYKDEFADLMIKASSQGVDLKIHTAFSRDGPKKQYVQHLLIDKGKQIWDLISTQGGYFYVCGYLSSDIVMPRTWPRMFTMQWTRLLATTEGRTMDGSRTCAPSAGIWKMFGR